MSLPFGALCQTDGCNTMAFIITTPRDMQSVGRREMAELRLWSRLDRGGWIGFRRGEESLNGPFCRVHHPVRSVSG